MWKSIECRNDNDNVSYSIVWFKYNKRKNSGSYNKRGWVDIFSNTIQLKKMDRIALLLRWGLYPH